MAKKSKGNTLKIIPIKALKLQKVFIKLGFKSYFATGGGSHIIVEVPNLNFPIAFGNHTGQEIPPVLINKLIKKAGITKKQYLEIFNSF